MIEGRKIDLLAARWLENGRHLEIVGVECKGAITPIGLSAVVADQLSHYVRSVPKIYVACSMPNREKRQDFKTFCQVAGVGLLGADEQTTALISRPPGEANVRLDNIKYQALRSRVALFLAFRCHAAISPAGFRGGRDDWISSGQPLERPQWNASLNLTTSSAISG